MTDLIKLIVDPITVSTSNVLHDSSLCLVGGAVRDVLEGKSDNITDFDFATKLTPPEVISRLEAAGLPHFNALRRGTVFTNIKGYRVDITTFRNPKCESEFVGTIEEDLAARDFTINAIALNIESGSIIDPFSGADDLVAGLVRCVGDPKARFTEDPHRIIRLVRFADAAGRNADPGSLNAAVELVHLIKGVAMERLGMEFYKIIMSVHPGAGIRGLQNLGILEHLLPEMVACIGCTQNKYHLFDVYNHILSVLDAVDSENKYARMAALFHDIGKPASKTFKENGECQFLRHEDLSTGICRTALNRLKFSSYFTEKVSFLVANHMRSVQMGKKGVRRLVRDLEFPHSLLDEWLSLKEADMFSGRPDLPKFKEEWDEFLATLKEVLTGPAPEVRSERLLSVTGDDIKALGFEQGPIIGKIISHLEDLVLESPDRNTPEYLLKEAADFKLDEP